MITPSASLHALKKDAALMRAAQKQADHMAKNGKISHFGAGHRNLTKRLAQQKIKVKIYGEVVGKASSFNEIILLWMKSPPHRRILLNKRYTHIGIGCARGHHAQLYCCQILAKK